MLISEKFDLRVPGPTPVPPRIYRAMNRPMINHRGGDFTALFQRLREGIKQIFQTENEVYFVTGSGTAGLEVAVANVVSPGDPVLVLVTGEFGDRFAKICAAYGAQVDRVDVPWGEAVRPELVAPRLATKRYRAVYATHNETSTGVENPIDAIGELVAETEALFVVDTVSSLGGMEFKADAWHCDLVVTGSQKALMLPPGMTLVSVSPKAWPVVEQAQSPRFYFDLRAYRKSAEKNETPFTPNVQILFGLDEALRMIQEEGLENAFARHRTMRRMIRAAVRALGMEPLAAEEVASNTVTAVKAPAGVDPDALRDVVKKRFGIVLAGGQGQLKGKIFRVGHLGYAAPMEMLPVAAALEMALTLLGHPVPLGKGVEAAEKELLAELR